MTRALSILLVLAGCGSRTFGRCDEAGRCSEYTYTDELWRLDLQADVCAGAWSWDGACSTDDAVGTCTFNGEFATTVHTYSTPDYDAASAELDCTTVVNGTFAP